jgi:hypothetical protein
MEGDRMGFSQKERDRLDQLSHDGPKRRPQCLHSAQQLDDCRTTAKAGHLPCRLTYRIAREDA